MDRNFYKPGWSVSPQRQVQYNFQSGKMDKVSIYWHSKSNPCLFVFWYICVCVCLVFWRVWGRLGIGRVRWQILLSPVVHFRVKIWIYPLHLWLGTSEQHGFQQQKVPSHQIPLTLLIIRPRKLHQLCRNRHQIP